MAVTDYALEGAKWGSADLGTAGGVVTWAVDSTIPASDLASITAALAEWSAVANIQFKEVASTAESSIDFTQGAIDGAGSVLAVTSFGFSAGQLQNATVEFDSGDTLAGSNLTLVAAHEIGHAIGLDHYNAADAVMNSAANFSLTGLTQSDIDGVQALYGANATTTPAAGDTPVAGTTPAAGDTPVAGTTPAAGDTPVAGTTPAAGDTPVAGTTPAAGDTPVADNTDTTGGAAGDGTAGTTPSGTTATGHGHAGSFHHGHGGGHGGGHANDIAGLLQSIQGDNTSTVTASNDDTHSASPVDISHVLHSHFEHMWG